MFENFNINQAITTLSITFVPVMLGIIVHEVAHAWVAKRCGDPTAAMLGRITLNPIPHIDPMGLAFYVLTSLTAPFVLGWAKPVPINYRNFRHITRDIFLVSFAGPASNLIQSVLWAIALRGIMEFAGGIANADSTLVFLANMCFAGVSVNLALAWFNLMPIPPLDGSKMLWTALPPRLGAAYMGLERYGMIIVLLLVMTGMFRYVLMPLILYSREFLLTVVGLG